MTWFLRVIVTWCCESLLMFSVIGRLDRTPSTAFCGVTQYSLTQPLRPGLRLWSGLHTGGDNLCLQEEVASVGPHKEKDLQKKEEAQEHFMEIQKAYERLSSIKAQRSVKSQKRTTKGRILIHICIVHVSVVWKSSRRSYAHFAKITDLENIYVLIIRKNLKFEKSMFFCFLHIVNCW